MQSCPRVHCGCPQLLALEKPLEETNKAALYYVQGVQDKVGAGGSLTLGQSAALEETVTKWRSAP